MIPYKGHWAQLDVVWATILVKQQSHKKKEEKWSLWGFDDL